MGAQAALRHTAAGKSAAIASHLWHQVLDACTLLVQALAAGACRYKWQDNVQQPGVVPVDNRAEPAAVTGAGCCSVQQNSALSSGWEAFPVAEVSPRYASRMYSRSLEARITCSAGALPVVRVDGAVQQQ